MTPAVHHLQSTGSTNEDLHALAQDGAPDGTVLVADTMTRGRGSRGRTWHAPHGGLWLSVLRRPVAPIETGVLSLRVGLALAPVLDQLAAHPVMLKWPNDLLLGDRKLGGILCEMRWQGDRPNWVVIGIGLNVQNPPPPELKDRATNLAKHVPGVRVTDVLESVVSPLRNIDVDRSELTPSDLRAFEERDWLRGRVLAAPVAGHVAGIDAGGALEVVTDDGTRHALLDAELVLA
jgi:BirA family biotin operon repressor/biotin-[acetyl-CoA-carboxylase] ligase